MYPEALSVRQRSAPLLWAKGVVREQESLQGAGKEGDLVTERQRREENGVMIIGDEVGDRGTEFSVRA